MRSISTSALNIRSGIRQFSPQLISISPHFWFSRRCDLNTLSQHSRLLSRARVDGAYKRKSQKIQPVDQKLLDGSKPDESVTWSVNAMKNEMPIHDPTNKYTHWLIPEFKPIAKRAKLTPERLVKLIIGEGMSPQEKDVLIEMLYKREAVLAWDFTEIGKVKKEVASA